MVDCVQRRLSRTGVCVVKVESQLGRLAVTVRSNADVEHVRVDEIQHFTDVETAGEAVRVFLARFSGSTPPLSSFDH